MCFWLLIRVLLLMIINTDNALASHVRNDNFIIILFLLCSCIVLEVSLTLLRKKRSTTTLSWFHKCTGYCINDIVAYLSIIFNIIIYLSLDILLQHHINVHFFKTHDNELLACTNTRTCLSLFLSFHQRKKNTDSVVCACLPAWSRPFLSQHESFFLLLAHIISYSARLLPHNTDILWMKALVSNHMPLLLIIFLL